MLVKLSFAVVVSLATLSLHGQLTEKVLKGTPDAGLAKMYDTTSVLSAKELKSLDFDAEMQKRPVADVSDPKFSESKARAWHKNTARLFSGALDKTSEQFQTKCIDLMRTLNQADKKDSEKAILSMLEQSKALPEGGLIDTFAKKFLVQYMGDNVTLYKAMAAAADFLKKIGCEEQVDVNGLTDIDKISLPRTNLLAVSAESRRETLKILREHESKIRLIIFDPGINNIDIIGRRTCWRMLRVVNDQTEKSL